MVEKGRDSGLRLGISIEKTLFYGRKHPNSNTGEFYNNDSVRRASFVEAVLLILKNLKTEEKLTKPILRHFIQISLNYKDFNLFKRIQLIGDFKGFQLFEMRLFYYTLPLRLFVYKQIKK